MCRSGFTGSLLTRGGFGGGLTGSGFSGGGFAGLTLGAFLRFALAAGFGQLLFLSTQGIGLGTRLFFATGQLDFGLVDLLRATRLIALDEHTLLLDFDLDGASLAGGVCLLDFGGRLAGQRDFLAVGPGRAVGGAQVIEQTLLVGLRQHVVGCRLGHAGRLELFQQCRSRAIQLRGELCDGGHGHCVDPCDELA